MEAIPAHLRIAIGRLRSSESASRVEFEVARQHDKPAQAPDPIAQEREAIVIKLALVAFVAQAWMPAPDIEPADWECATPLIEKNALREIDAQSLAARISDECQRAFVRVAGEPQLIQQSRLNLHVAKALAFQSEILSEIRRLRRARDVPLVR